MKNNIIANFEKKFQKTESNLPKFRPGDTVRVHYRIQEGGDKKKFRVQPYEGVVLKFKKGTADATFTVRKMGANGVGVERVFPLISTNIEKIDVLSHGIVRRSRLFYLRKRSGKSARIKSRFVAKGASR